MNANGNATAETPQTLSVLIAAYRAQDWIAACLDSVFAQQLPPGWRLQVLLGIDGCADTLAVARTLAHHELEVVHVRRNQGTYVTFNTLMLYASGDLICRFDADDVMLPDYLAAQIHAIERGADMTLTWSIYTDAQLHPVPVRSKKHGLEDANGHCRTAWEGQFVVRREVWRRLGGFQAWRTSADTDFLNRAKAAGFRHAVVERFLYLRRIHGNSLTAHPDSNFDSLMRRSVELLIADYDRQYRAGERGVRLDPECADDHARFTLDAPAPP